MSNEIKVLSIYSTSLEVFLTEDEYSGIKSEKDKKAKFLILMLIKYFSRENVFLSRGVFRSFKRFIREAPKFSSWATKYFDMIYSADELAVPDRLFIVAFIESELENHKNIEKVVSNSVGSFLDHYRWDFENVMQQYYLYNILLKITKKTNCVINQKSLVVISKEAKAIALKRGYEIVEHMARSESSGDEKKVLITIGFLPENSEATHLTLMYQMASTIKMAFPGAKVFLAITGEKFHESTFLNSNVKNYDAGIKNNIFNIWKEINENDGSVYFPSCQDAKSYFSWVSSINPDLIVGVGGVYSATFSNSILYSKYPIMLLPASNQNEISFPVDAVLARNHKFKNKILYAYPKIYVKEIPLYSNFSLLNNDAYEENIFDTEEEKKIIAFCLKDRLVKGFSKFSESDFDLFFEVFNNNEELVLLLIGEDCLEKLFKLDERFLELYKNKRMQVIIKTQRLRGLYQKVSLACTLPGLSGGGGAINAARLDGVPTICWDQADISWRIPSEYHYSNVKEMCQLIVMLLSSSETMEKNVLSVLDFNSNSKKIREVWPSFYQETVKIAALRINLNP